jgi:hypothetical protein
MHLLGHFSNPSSSLQAIFNALPDEPLAYSVEPAPAVPVAAQRLGNGVVQRAVIKTLGAVTVPMRASAIHAAVEARLGHVVSKESVSWCLRTGCGGDEPRFERVSYGCYRLVRPS